jgi:cytochrome c biogenesis protein CcmG/thiol:disulfide interchange protein DsbE
MRLSPKRIECLAGLILLLLLAGIPKATCQTNVYVSLKAVGQRKSAPELVLEDSAGKPFTLKQYAGKIVLLDFWATWCHGCQEEIPWFSDFHREYGPEGLSVVGVSLDEDGWKAVKPFIKTAAVPYRIVLGNDTIARRYGIAAMPDTFLIDRNGKVAAKYAGVVNRTDIEKNIKAMLAEK